MNQPIEHVTVYAKRDDGTGPCPYCEKAKSWLAERGIPYHLVEMTQQERQGFYDRMELVGRERTVPQVMIQDIMGDWHRIGGYAELQNSRLETLFQENIS